MSFVEYCRVRKRNKHFIQNAQALIDKELDLKRFLDRIRLHMTAITGLLTPKQMIFA